MPFVWGLGAVRNISSEGDVVLLGNHVALKFEVVVISADLPKGLVTKPKSAIARASEGPDGKSACQLLHMSVLRLPRIRTPR